jgi:hypothetical protein
MIDFPFDETMQAVGNAVVSVTLGRGETNLFWYSATDGRGNTCKARCSCLSLLGTCKWNVLDFWDDESIKGWGIGFGSLFALRIPLLAYYLEGLALLAFR